MAASTHDLAALQGVWKQIAFEENGLVNPPDDTSGAMGSLTTITGYHFAVRAVTGELLLEGDFEIDASTTPKSVTWIDSMGPDKGKKLPAIYTLEGDAFTFIAADEGMARATEFLTVPGLTLRSFQRQR